MSTQWRDGSIVYHILYNIVQYSFSVLQNVQSEVEERALYLTERRPVFDSVFRQEHMEQSSRMHRVSHTSFEKY